MIILPTPSLVVIPDERGSRRPTTRCEDQDIRDTVSPRGFNPSKERAHDEANQKRNHWTSLRKTPAPNKALQWTCRGYGSWKRTPQTIELAFKCGLTSTITPLHATEL